MIFHHVINVEKVNEMFYVLFCIPSLQSLVCYFILVEQIDSDQRPFRKSRTTCGEGVPTWTAQGYLRTPCSGLPICDVGVIMLTLSVLGAVEDLAGCKL